LFIVLSLFTLYLFLIGYVSTGFLKARDDLSEQVALTLSVGILINYCLMLTGQTITRVFIAGAIVAVWGMVKFFTDLRVRPASGASAYKTPVFSLLCIIYILAVYYLTILSEPLARWDARSIWFFHAKMI